MLVRLGYIGAVSLLAILFGKEADFNIASALIMYLKLLHGDLIAA